MRRKVLFVDDDERQRTPHVEALSGLGWEVETAVDGREALEKLRSAAGAYDLVVLDLVMPEMGGEEVLERIRDEEITAPPIIVLSAFAEGHLQKCRYLGAAHVLKKPYDPMHLDQIAGTVMRGARPDNTDVKFDEDLLDYMVRRRHDTLKKWLDDVARGQDRLPNVAEPLFVVARRWNSWYPSVFPVSGGAYAVIGRPKDLADSRYRAAAIDPGFQSLRIFSELGLPWQDIETLTITHNHPDHIGGVFELLAARNALSRRTRVLCNPSCTPIFQHCAGFGCEAKTLGESSAELLKPYEGATSWWYAVRAKPFDIAHDEIGPQNAGKGLVLVLDVGCDADSLEETTELVLLGDTQYDRGEHRKKWMPVLCGPNSKLVVLHIGSAELRQRTGKHLYLPGIRNILLDMDSELSATHYKGRQLVLVSEWGLEHATQQQIAPIIGSRHVGFDDYSPILETIKVLRRELKKIVLLPADIGLIVGMESGNVYVNGEPISPEDVCADLGKSGIEYARRQATPLSS